MTRLRFKYYMKLSFSDTVEKHRFSLKCIPKSDVKQRIYITHRDIYPNSFISEDTDSFGNLIIYGYEESKHKYFFFDIEGEAVTGMEAAQGSEMYKDGTDPETLLMKYQTAVTMPGDAIRAYYMEIAEGFKSAGKLGPEYGLTDADDTVNFGLYTMSRLGRDFEYESGVTDIQTTAEDAMRSGKGVCQDYAHIMLSLCRLRRIPCRYVTGMMLGEGESHAWVEVLSGEKWIGMDPTNSQLVGDYYIKIAHGRDYSDCLVNQGLFTGAVRQEQKISVNVEEIT